MLAFEVLRHGVGNRRRFGDRRLLNRFQGRYVGDFGVVDKVIVLLCLLVCLCNSLLIRLVDETATTLLGSLCHCIHSKLPTKSIKQSDTLGNWIFLKNPIKFHLIMIRINVIIWITWESTTYWNHIIWQNLAPTPVAT